MKILLGKSFKTRSTNEIVDIVSRVNKPGHHDNGLFRGFYRNGGWAYWDEDGFLMGHNIRIDERDLVAEELTPPIAKVDCSLKLFTLKTGLTIVACSVEDAIKLSGLDHINPENVKVHALERGTVI